VPDDDVVESHVYAPFNIKHVYYSRFTKTRNFESMVDLLFFYTAFYRNSFPPLKDSIATPTHFKTVSCSEKKICPDDGSSTRKYRGHYLAI